MLIVLYILAIKYSDENHKEGINSVVNKRRRRKLRHSGSPPFV